MWERAASSTLRSALYLRLRWCVDSFAAASVHLRQSRRHWRVCIRSVQVEPSAGTTDRPLREEDKRDAPETLAARIEANAVAPHRFKAVMGRHFADYGTSDQQDASYFFMHFLSLLENQERAQNARLQSPHGRLPCSRLFVFSQEQRIQCSESGAVSYTYTEPTQLSLHIPLDAASNRREVVAYKAREETRKKLSETQAEAYIGAEVRICLAVDLRKPGGRMCGGVRVIGAKVQAPATMWPQCGSQPRAAAEADQ